MSSWLSPDRTYTEVVRVAASVVAVVLVFSMIANASDRRAHDDPDGLAADIVRQSIQWLDMAAQDTDPMTRWQHLALAKAYLNVARNIASDATIERATQAHVRALSKRIEAEMHNSVQMIHKLCHKLKPQVQIQRGATLPGEEGAAGGEKKRVTWM